MTTDQKRAFTATFPVHVGVDSAKIFHKLVARDPTASGENPTR